VTEHTLKSAEYRASSATTPREAAQNKDFVFVCVGNDDDVRGVVLGADGVLAGMKEGAVLIDHTTTSADLARELAAAAAKTGVEFLDAPVSGGQAGAVNGKLTIMVGGDAPTFAKTLDAMNVFARATTHMGAHGAGQLTKMVNQICIASLLQGLSEGMAFAQKAGLDGNMVLDVISKGAAQSWQMENRGKTMLKREFNFGFAVDWMHKDLGICLDEAARNGAKLPVTTIVDGYYQALQKQGDGRGDTSSLIKLL
jgi:3-hydroxyisobutyrate dehydrogenase-like beta-hydroxyacid dehydrogenase